MKGLCLPLAALADGLVSTSPVSPDEQIDVVPLI